MDRKYSFKGILHEHMSSILALIGVCVCVSIVASGVMHAHHISHIEHMEKQSTIQSLSEEQQVALLKYRDCMQDADETTRQLCDLDTEGREALMREINKFKVYKKCMANAGSSLEEGFCNRIFGKHAAGLSAGPE